MILSPSQILDELLKQNLIKDERRQQIIKDSINSYICIKKEEFEETCNKIDSIEKMIECSSKKPVLF